MEIVKKCEWCHKTFIGTFLLRLTATPCAAWHSLSTSAHCLVNVMRRHELTSHAVSVKHYEAVWC